jgi:hypothetical protein
MRPIIVVMLCVQLAILLATAFAVVVRKPKADKRRPIWSSFAVSLFIVGMVSVEIAGDHPTAAGADILTFGGPLLIGMALMSLLILLRQRRGFDMTA